MALIVLNNEIFEVTPSQLRTINSKLSKVGFNAGGYSGVAQTFNGLSDFKEWLYSQDYKKIGKVSFNDSEY